MMLINRLFAQSNMEADQSTASLLREAAEALALAQPQQEPVYVQLRYKDDEGYWSPWGTPLDPSLRNKKWAPEFEMRLLYDEPPAREPLTDDEIGVIWEQQRARPFKTHGEDRVAFARAIEAAHGIKDTP